MTNVNRIFDNEKFESELKAKKHFTDEQIQDITKALSNSLVTNEITNKQDLEVSTLKIDSKIDYAKLEIQKEIALLHKDIEILHKDVIAEISKNNVSQQKYFLVTLISIIALCISIIYYGYNFINSIHQAGTNNTAQNQKSK